MISIIKYDARKHVPITNSANITESLSKLWTQMIRPQLFAKWNQSMVNKRFPESETWST